MSQEHGIPSGAITDEQRSIVKASAPVLVEHGQAITKRFYAQMLEAHPDLKNVFNMSHQATGHQAEALASAVYAYAVHIDDLSPILPVVDRINQKHASLHITPPQYAIVGKFLLAAIADVLGADIFTGALYEAWAAAYWQLARIFIDREAALYAQAGWTGYKDFIVAKRVQETPDIVSFHLAPKEGSPNLAAYRPGQFISVRKYITELGVDQCRQYSLSDAPSATHYRISIARDRGTTATKSTGTGDLAVDITQSNHPGWVSNLLHDTLKEGDIIQVAYPFGDFFLDSGSGPIVFLAAGVGVTPLMAMLNTLLSSSSDEASSERKISWVQAARSPAALPFKAHIGQLLATYPDRLHTQIFYKNPEGAAAGESFVQGRMSLAQVDSDLLHLDDQRTQYYVCGPESFTIDVSRALRELGIDHGHVHAEVFGSGGLQL